MPDEPQKPVRNRGALLFGVLQFAVLAGLVLMALRPDFKGGIMITVIIAGTVLLQLVASFGDFGVARKSGKQPPARPASHGEEAPLEVSLFLRILLMVLTLLIVCYFLGVYAGFVFFLFFYWWRVARFSPLFSLVLALFFGLLLPIFFGSLVNTTMWPGTIPELIPEYLGGAVSPPW